MALIALVSSAKNKYQPAPYKFQGDYSGVNNVDVFYHISELLDRGFTKFKITVTSGTTTLYYAVGGGNLTVMSANTDVDISSATGDLYIRLQGQPITCEIIFS